jgi:hypothetical protein
MHYYPSPFSVLGRMFLSRNLQAPSRVPTTTSRIYTTSAAAVHSPKNILRSKRQSSWKIHVDCLYPALYQVARCSTPQPALQSPSTHVVKSCVCRESISLKLPVPTTCRKRLAILLAGILIRSFLVQFSITIKLVRYICLPSSQSSKF